MAPKLTSCDVFGMLKYGLSTEGGFVRGDKVNAAGVLVSGIRLLSLLVPVTGGDMTSCWEEFAHVMLAVVLFVGCLVACAAALNLGQFVDDAATVACAAAVAVVWAPVDGVWAAAELAAAMLTWLACAAVTACIVVDPGPGSADVPVHVAVKMSVGSAGVNVVNAAAVDVLVVLV